MRIELTTSDYWMTAAGKKTNVSFFYRRSSNGRSTVERSRIASNRSRFVVVCCNRRFKVTPRGGRRWRVDRLGSFSARRRRLFGMEINAACSSALHHYLLSAMIPPSTPSSNYRVRSLDVSDTKLIDRLRRAIFFYNRKSYAERCSTR